MDETSKEVYTALLLQLASPLGTQPEVLAGMLREIEHMHLMGQITDWQLQNARAAYARTPATKTAEVASWAVDKAKEGLHAGAALVRDRTRTALTTYTLRDPIRAILIAAGTGALLMVLASILARSGARKLRRQIYE